MGWYLGLAGLVFQAALLFVAIRSYRAKRTTTLRYLLWACICYVVAASSWYTFNFAAGFMLKSDALTPAMRHTVAECRYYVEQSFEILFAILMIAALISFVRQRHPTDTLASNQTRSQRLPYVK
jgi:hypothetical protein